MSDSSADDTARKERRREQNRKYRAANRDRLLEYQRSRYQASREQRLERQKQYYEANRDTIRDRVRAAYAAAPEKYRADRRRYVEANRDSVNKRQRDRFRDNPEPYRERNREWRLSNPDQVKANNKRGNLRWRHGIDEAAWAAMWEAQEGKCRYCRRALDETAVVEHWHECGTGHEQQEKSCPACRRGLACQSCNITIGLVKDDPDRLALMAENLRIANAEVQERQKNAPEQLQFEL